jgi:hypothetical protein
MLKLSKESKERFRELMMNAVLTIGFQFSAIALLLWLFAMLMRAIFGVPS